MISRKLMLLGEIGVDLRQGRAAIDLRLAGAEQVEVGAVQDQQLRHSGGRATRGSQGGEVWPNTSRVSRS